MDEVAEYKRYLDSLRSAALWKLEGLEPWQLRWPMTPTGTNLLGILKHLGAMEYGYFGIALGKPGEPLPFMAQDAEPNADMWVTQDETTESVIQFYRRAVAHSDANLAELTPDAPAHVPWWPQPDVTLRRLLIHMVAEVARHVGHMDVLRERLDGRVGMSESKPNLPPADEHSWAEHVEQVRASAVAASWPGAQAGLYGGPGPHRESLISALCLGEKSATSSLLAAYDSGADVPQVGEIEVVLSSALMPAVLVETADVRVIRLADVGLEHAQAEGFTDVATWRSAHEKFWSTPEALADLDDPAFTVDDDTPVVVQKVRVLEVLKSW